MRIIATRTEGLGDSTYLVIADGIGVLVDPQRDYERFLRDLGDATLSMVLETHLHNDYVSGGMAVAEATGADLILPAAAGAAFPYRPAFHLEEIDTGPFRIRPVHTPGHTPEHTSYVLVVDDEPQAVFSGGSLLVASAGRTDLLGDDRARQLARLQYGSVNRLAELPDDVGLYPTHGEGSFCASSGAGRHTSSIGREKASSPVLKHPDADSFADAELAGLQPYPSYYAHMSPINLAGPSPIEKEPVPHLSIEEMSRVIQDEHITIVDIRPREHFAAGHLAGAIGVELADAFGTWVGWLADFDSPIVLVADPEQDLDEAWTQLSRIGMDHHRGAFVEMQGWAETGRPMWSYEALTVNEFRTRLDVEQPAQLLDVRSPDEYAGGSLPGAAHQYLPDLRGTIPDFDPERTVLVACGSGYRATAAAGILEAAGFQPVVLAEGGVDDVLEMKKSARRPMNVETTDG